MAKQLNVNLSFTADSSAAKKNIQDLQMMLKNLTKVTNSDLKINDSIETAIRSAAELKTHLEAATNIKTGNLDFTKLNDSLKQSGKNLGEYGEQLLKLGPEGQKAFHALASSVAQAEIPIKRSNAALSEMWVTLKNTTRWQMSSSILHGFMGAIQGAYGYAQDLNESLNNIRIVTGQSTEEMAKFAEMANRSAKSLSATTTDYTNAALIYYQQGLTDDQVKERTDITVKMANVARQSSEVVSDQLTAIWNNFYDGSKSLGYYADVMTALGAATASSTDEIAGGLEKFAAIGNTIGLSYEYAASALATITSNTRQSEEVVGTALKTIFARIQGLNLGETLEDGTSLNKYSQALEKVGISIFEQNGEIKKMDNILDEMAVKWGTLAKDQQIALAQTVAGVRQYTQLIALMDNWNAGDADSMMSNLNTVKNSDGALQGQADTYAESWEAAQKRVQASLQAIYENIIDDDAFIGILDTFSDLLDGVNYLIDAVGGLNGVLGVLGAVLGKVFHKQLSQSIKDFGYSIAMTTEAGREKVRQAKKDEIHEMIDVTKGGEYNTRGDIARADALEEELLLQAQLIDSSDKMSESELKVNQILLDRVKILNEQKVAAAEKLQEAEDKRGDASYQAKVEITKDAMSKGKDNNYIKEQEAKFGKLYKKLNTSIKIQVDTKGLKKLDKDSEEAKKKIDSIRASLRDLDAENDTQLESIFDQALEEGQDLTEVCTQLDARIDSIISKTTGDMFSLGVENNTIEELEQGMQEAEEAMQDFNVATENSEKAHEGFQESLDETKQVIPTWADGIAAYGTAISSVVGIINIFKSTIDTIRDPDASGWEKFSSILLGVGSAIGLITMAFTKERVAAMASTVASIASALGFTGVATSATAAATGTASFGAALWTVLWPIGLVIAAIAALIGIVVGLYKLFNQPTDAEKNLQKTAKAAENAKKSFEDTTTAANELKSALDNYDSLVDTFNNCTIGTAEWRDAMHALNVEVNNLLEKYPELRKYLVVDEKTGALSFSKEGLEEVRNTTTQRTNAAMINSAIANQNEAKAQVIVDKDEVSNVLGNLAVNYESYASQAIMEALSSNQIRGEEGFRESDIAAIMAVMEQNFREKAAADVEYFTGLKQGDVGFQEEVNKYLSNTGFFDEFGNAIKDQFDEQQDLIADIFENDNFISAVQNYVASVEGANTDATIAIANLTSALLSERTDLNNAGKQVAAVYIENDIAQRKATIIQEEKDNHTDRKDSNAEALWNRYMEAIGEDWELDKNAIQGSDTNRSYAYRKEKDGEVETISIEDMAGSIAAFEALAEVGVQADKAAQTLANLNNNVPKDIAKGLTDYLVSGNFNSFSQTDLSTLQSELDIDDSGNASKESVDNYLMGAFGVNSTEELQTILGEKYYENFNEAQRIYADALEDFSESIPKQLQETFDSLSTEGLSLSGKQSILDMLEHAMIEGGTSARDSLSQILGNLSTEELDQFSQALSNIDWKTATIEDVSKALNSANISSEDLGISLIDLMNCMKVTRTEILTTTQDTYKSLQEIVKDLSTGDTINSKKYEELVNNFGETFVDSYFSVMADGTYQLIGDAKQFYDLVTQKSKDQFLTNIQSSANITDSLSSTSVERMNSGAISTSDTADSVIAYLRTLELTTDELLALSEAESQYAAAGAYSAESFNTLNSLMANHNITQEEFNSLIDQNTANMVLNSQALLSTATSLEELDELSIQVAQSTGGVVHGYGEALINLGSKYENCTEEIEEYSQALLEGNEDTIKAKQEALKAAVAVGELAETYDLNSEDLEDYAKRLAELHKDSNLSIKDATKLAAANMRLDRGIANLNDNLDDYKKALKESNKGSAEWSNTLSDLKTDLADVLNVADGSMLSDAFAEATLNSEDLKLALDGDSDAILRLRLAAADDIIANLSVDDSNLASVQENWEFLKANLAQDIQAGGINDAKMVDAFNDMIEKGNMTKEQIEAALAGLNVSANVHTEYVAQKVSVPTTITDQVRYPIGSIMVDKDMDGTPESPVTNWRTETRTHSGPPVEVDGYVPKYSIEGTEGSGSISSSFTSLPAPKVSRSSTSSGRSGGGGGSNSAPQAVDKKDLTKKSDVSERYKEVNDAIDNVTDALTRAEKASDRLWGKDKLDAMRQENKILQEQYKLLQDKAKEAEEYAKQDAANLRKVADEANISFVIDQKTGDITNIESQMDILYQRLHQAEEQYNKDVEAYNKAIEKAEADGKISDSEAENLEKMKEALDAYESGALEKIENEITGVQDAVALYEESRELFEQLGIDMEDIQDQIMQNNYDIIMEGLEIPIALNEEDLRLIDLQLSKLEDDVYGMAEAVAFTSSKLDEYKDNLRLADEALAELNRAHEAGEITDAAYQEGLGEIRDKYYDNVEALMELDTTMKEYYSNTLDMANEELSKYTEQMEHQTSVLEHYQSLIELMGKSTDYKMIGKILEGQVETTKNSMEVSKQWYETQRNNADALAAEYAAALANNASEAELEIIKANWEAAEASANEAQDQMLSDAEAWAEALKAVLENELADLSQTLENALTGGTSFDTLTTQMERAASLQEEYLTTTNQIYETNKLMRTAQQEIDKTTNAVAKKKLKAYINETEQLQNQSKLSQYELEIQQAKYNLLLAEIALQEAQDAKSTVRLQRDSEGNFGYVYTADSNKINEAQQKLEDAQNDLYNKGLDGANDYAQKYQQTMQEMYDTLADIQQRYLDGEYETEAEYHAAMEEAKAYYYQKLQDYSSLYSVAVTADSRVVADAWSTDFASMIYDTDNWKQAVEDYTDDAIAAFTKWQNAITGEGGIADLIGNSVEDVGKTVQEVTDKSKELAKKTQEEVIPALDKELDSVNNLTGAYAKMRDTIKETIEYYTNMINRINNSQTSDWNSGSEGSDDSSTPEDGGSGSGGGNSDTIPGGQDDGQGEGSPDTIPGGSPEGEGGSGISYHSGTLKFSGSGANRVWTDASGKTYAYGSPEQKAFQKAFDKAYGRNGGYKGDYWIGWTNDGGKLNADVLHEKYGLATGGYTGDWAGSYGKLAFLHQKELVLNAQDTENFLASMEVMERILQVIDMQSANAQLGGILSSPGFNGNNSQIIEQSVHIEASFPGVQDRSEIEEAFNNLINKASQYANRK